MGWQLEQLFQASDMPAHACAAAVTFLVPKDGVSSPTPKRTSSKESTRSRSDSSFGLFLEGSFADLLDSHVSFALEVCGVRHHLYMSFKRRKPGRHCGVAFVRLMMMQISNGST